MRDDTPPPNLVADIPFRLSYQSFSHSLWSRQQQQRAQIDEEITRVMRPPLATASSEAATLQSPLPAASRLMARPASSDAGGTVKVKVAITRSTRGDGAPQPAGGIAGGDASGQ